MFRPFRLKSFTPLVAVLAVLALAGQQQAMAQPKPFAIAGAGVATTGLPLPGQPAREHPSVGLATHLGVYHGSGSVKTDTADFDPNIGDFGGFAGEFGSGSPYEFTGTNGDKLVTYYGRTDKGATEPGTFTLTIVGLTEEGAPIVEAFFLAEFVAQPLLSTGKFKGATGSWIMYAWTAPFVLGSEDPTPYAWAGAGQLKLKK